MSQVLLMKVAEHFRTGTPLHYKKGENIILAGQKPEGVLWLQEGIIEQYDITPEGNKVTVNVFKPPAFLPMSWAINKTPNEYFFTALSDVSVIRADADETVNFIKTNPDVMFDLLARVYKGTDGLLRRLVLATSDIAIKRLVYELLLEAYRFGEQKNFESKEIAIKQQTLASRSGLARETISRELHKLEHMGVLVLGNKKIQINMRQLENLLNL